ncbi:MAG: RNB domain-containing ribonuclease, partial [Proteobacteria bacterium]|nr:RNB domain-containing ribonuclease [Pseudomonadota bacterium]
TYFSDRVVPMLPEDLSNGLCSLKPHEDRACMAFHLCIDKDGNLTSQKVVRALMNSAARLTYDQVQAAKDGAPDATTKLLMDNVINPLYAAFKVLRQARDKRGAMNLDMPEYKAEVNDKGEVTKLEKATRPESCKVIEEFMVLANVAAATTLESKGAPCVYRVHDTPPDASIDNLRDYVSAFGLTLPAGEIKSPADFKEVLEKASQIPNGHLVIKAILRAQAKAAYDTNNIGHFGLALEKYAHFTSPIRRYADLLVHRSLTDVFNMGQGALDTAQKAQMQDMTLHISKTENLSAKAERSARDRFAAKYLSKHLGEEFTGSITGVTKAGLFIRLKKKGADGLLPISNLPPDYYDLDNDQYTLTGRKSGRVYRIGATITVSLKEADELSGSVLLAAANDNGADIPGVQFKKRAKKPADSRGPQQ